MIWPHLVTPTPPPAAYAPIVEAAGLLACGAIALTVGGAWAFIITALVRHRPERTP